MLHVNYTLIALRQFIDRIVLTFCRILEK